MMVRKKCFIFFLQKTNNKNSPKTLQNMKQFCDTTDPKLPMEKEMWYTK